MEAEEAQVDIEIEASKEIDKGAIEIEIEADIELTGNKEMEEEIGIIQKGG